MTNSFSEFLRSKEEIIGGIVRDMCSVGTPLVKSEARRRVEDLLREAAQWGKENKNGDGEK